MVRRLLILVLACGIPALLHAQSTPPAEGELKPRQHKQDAPKGGAKEEMPPEEDVDMGNIEYSFNPLQAEKDVKVGNFYFKQGKYRAAEGRFRAATKWNDGFADAWLRLGEAAEKLKDPKAAREAYTKYLEIASDAKDAREIRKRLQKLK